MSAKAPAKGHTAKHVHKQAKHHKVKGKHHPAAQHKPAGGTAHRVHTVAHHPKPAKPAGFAIGDLLPACVAEALATSLRLAGGAVSDEDVLRLHVLAAGAEDVPASIPDGLEAAFRFGLAGCKPTAASLPLPRHGREGSGWWNRTTWSPHEGLWRHPDAPADLNGSQRTLANPGLILRIDHPGSHAVLAVPDGWWSWGELWSPWPARVCEAWAVSWS